MPTTMHDIIGLQVWGQPQARESVLIMYLQVSEVWNTPVSNQQLLRQGSGKVILHILLV